MTASSWPLILPAFALPAALCGALLAGRASSRVATLLAGVLLIACADIDVFVVQRFAAALSPLLFLAPALFGGIGVQLICRPPVGRG